MHFNFELRRLHHHHNIVMAYMYRRPHLSESKSFKTRIFSLNDCISFFFYLRYYKNYENIYPKLITNLHILYVYTTKLIQHKYASFYKFREKKMSLKRCSFYQFFRNGWYLRLLWWCKKGIWRPNIGPWCARHGSVRFFTVTKLFWTQDLSLNTNRIW